MLTKQFGPLGAANLDRHLYHLRGYKFDPTPDQRTLADSRARQAIIPSGQLNNRLSEYVHIMGRSRMQLFSGVHDIEDIPPDADIRGYV